jgi:sorbitol-specific phosphotransferase system component IIBC
MSKLRWGRGLFRLWLAGSVLWVLVILGVLLNRAFEHEQAEGPIGGTYYHSWFTYLVDWNWPLILIGPLLGAGAVIAVAIFIKIAVWIWRGFAPPALDRPGK